MGTSQKMMELRKRNNNHEEPNRDKLQKLEKELKKLETPIETRINVNLCLLVYWLPAYIIDFGAQFPTFNGIHIFTDFLSNWGQTVILGHLLFSLKMDFDNDFRLKWKKVYNKYVQIAMAQAIIVSCLFWGLVGGEISLQNVHEHVMNVIVMLISYTVSEVRFRKRDLWMAWFYGWMYCLNTYMAFLAGRDGVYAILAWGEKKSDFPLSTFQLFSYAVWGGMTAIHATLYSYDQLRWKIFDHKQNKIKMQIQKITRGGS